MKQLWTWGPRKKREFEEVERGFENERGEGGCGVYCFS